ncbi:hypothetical protein [Parasitella parasitica]|uniref:Uncharacterized protein n=1 Tax=Parasitella parasitica TaxID=35722 RepID=A0A0B7N4U2_9FUNG|nr:hypothetical protein [Parasitella parasitica]
MSQTSIEYSSVHSVFEKVTQHTEETFPHLIDLAARNWVRSMNAVNTELAGISDMSSSASNLPDRYFHIRIPYINGPMNVFSVISTSTYIIGMIGSYKKSPKLIKYHKHLLFFDVISTPLILIECIWTSSPEWSRLSMPDSLDTPVSFENDMKKLLIMFMAFIGVAASSVYLQQIYAAFVAYKYEKYLVTTNEEMKEK